MGRALSCCFCVGAAQHSECTLPGCGALLRGAIMLQPSKCSICNLARRSRRGLADPRVTTMSSSTAGKAGCVPRRREPAAAVAAHHRPRPSDPGWVPAAPMHVLAACVCLQRKLCGSHPASCRSTSVQAAHPDAFLWPQLTPHLQKNSASGRSISRQCCSRPEQSRGVLRCESSVTPSPQPSWRATRQRSTCPAAGPPTGASR